MYDDGVSIDQVAVGATCVKTKTTEAYLLRHASRTGCSSQANSRTHGLSDVMILNTEHIDAAEEGTAHTRVTRASLNGGEVQGWVSGWEGPDIPAPHWSWFWSAPNKIFA